MGRLLNPGIGDLVDRLTILRLKIRNAPAATVTDHLRAEMAQIRMRLDAAGHPRTNDIVLLCAHLQEKNAKLWNLEDRMATFSKDDAWLQNKAMCAATAVDIWRTNRERNNHIQAINRATGTDHGPEKL